MKGRRAADNKEYDIGRGITLGEFGIQIIRFTNKQVIEETDNVIDQIKTTIETLKLKHLHKSNQNSGLDKSPLGDLGADFLEKNFLANTRLDESIQKLINY